MDILRRLAGQVRRTPGRTALIAGGESMTYRRLADVTEELAGRMVGAGPGRTVALHLPQGMAALVGMLATLRAGAAWVVVEPGHPAVRLRAVLDSTDCAAIVHLPGADVPAQGPTLIDYTARGPGGAVASRTVDGRHPAYLVLTSGTTGRPKTVAISRSNLDVAIADHVGLYGPAPVFLPAMSVSFDGVLTVLFATLVSGGTVVLPDARELRDPVAVSTLANQHRITHLFAVPSFYDQLLGRAEPLPDSLAMAFIGGEVVTPALVEQHRTALPGARLMNVYGPAETSMVCTAHQVLGSPKRTVPIGRAFAGVVTRVLDERLRPVPPGRIGELYIGGGYVGLGYAGAPVSTAERFVADPHGHGARMYRTGDLAAVNPDGELEFHGRTDDQVKVRGVRVELAEIEHVVRGHDAVRQAAVLTTADHGVVAFVVPAGEDGQVGARLRAFCAERLIEQAVPALFVPVDRIPLTHNGKIDRSALLTMIPATSPGTIPGTEAQRQVAAEWGAVLRHHDFGPHDNFWRVGGTSMKLMDLYERLDARWPGVFRIGELFDLDTIEAQADAVATRTGGVGVAFAVRLEV
ncbi:non-ribosomal peptide synthetase [Nonomuraea guangzhouensis]|uniref:Amino acid adenylation domain-containing protein n=1 Tax=Nonomuraea guangzhouensis TaxID=1291555 RepID=A0ABW4GAZ0_9ACTN|nr:amino acid adenylation domain-containing protein [Nonomuraea guangzhouensis]